MGRFGLRPGSGFGEIKENLIPTSVPALMTDVRDIETDVASPAKMGDKTNPERVSRGASLVSKVEMTQSRF